VHFIVFVAFTQHRSRPAR